jgi:hypothetical protein
VYKQGVIVGTPTRSKVVRNLLKGIGHAPLPSDDHVLEVVTAKRVQTTSSETVKKPRGRPKKQHQQQELKETEKDVEEEIAIPKYNLRRRVQK